MHGGALRVIDLNTGEDMVVAQAEGVTFGLAEFVAAEEMDRSRGYWWSPDGTKLLVARVDEAGVARWHIADPANPDKAPVEVRYPAAGTANADVSLLVAALPAATQDDTVHIAQTPLAVISPAGAQLAEVAGWDRVAFPYLVNAHWGDDLLLVVQTRDQKTMRIVNAVTGAVVREDTNPDWTDVVDGVPAQLASGDIVWTGISGDTRGLIIAPAAGLAAATPVTPPGLQVQAVIGTDGDDVLFTGSTESTEVGVWRYGAARSPRAGSRRSRPRPACTPPWPPAGRPWWPAGRWRAATSPCGSPGTAGSPATSPRTRSGRTCRTPRRSSSRPGRPASARRCCSRPGMSRARGCRC